jgi:hypothetical protein
VRLAVAEKVAVPEIVPVALLVSEMVTLAVADCVALTLAVAVCVFEPLFEGVPELLAPDVSVLVAVPVALADQEVLTLAVGVPLGVLEGEGVKGTQASSVTAPAAPAPVLTGAPPTTDVWYQLTVTATLSPGAIYIFPALALLRTGN